MTPSPSPHSCKSCGQPLPAAAPDGLCPRCLMAGAMQPTEPATWGIPDLAAVRAAFPQLEVLSLIGAGGMGAVFKARQPQLNRLVALKILAAERTEDPRFAARFQHEAQTLAHLSHPRIITIHDFGRSGDFYYLLMEFIDGVNLRQAMKGGHFTPEQALAVVPPVCEALQYAHEHRVVHRDIKPENLLLDRQGQVKIADFGIAKMLDLAPDEASIAESQPAGTPQYMAPEQKAGSEKADHRADIYSLGVVLYEMLTGELPGDKLQPPSAKVNIDVRLDSIVLRALERNPELRYQTAGEFRTQVETVAVPAEPAPQPTPRLRPAGLGYAAIFFVGLSGVLGIAALAHLPHPPDAIAHPIPGAALVGVALALAGRKQLLARVALVIGCANLALWVFFAAVGLPVGEKTTDGHWIAQPMKWSERDGINASAYLRIVSVTQEGRIVVFRIIHETWLPNQAITFEFHGPELEDAFSPKHAGQFTGIIAPTRFGRAGQRLGKVLLGTSEFRGPGTFQVGFAFPDTTKAAMVVEQAQGLYMGKLARLSVGDVLALFSLLRKGGSKIPGELYQGLLHVESAPSSTSTAAAPAELHFNETVELTLPFMESPCGLHHYLRFATGDILDEDFCGPAGPHTAAQKEQWELRSDQHDVEASSLADGLQFVGSGCVFHLPSSSPPKQWEAFTPNEVDAALRRAQWMTGTLELQSKDLPCFAFFKTAAGDRGLLELTAISQNPPAIRLRYRLAETAETTAKRVALAAKEAGVIEGTVTTEDGSPVADARVDVIAGYDILHVTTHGATGPDGRYRIAFRRYPASKETSSNLAQRISVQIKKAGFAEKSPPQTMALPSDHSPRLPPFRADCILVPPP